MRKRKKGFKLGRKKEHRELMLRNLAESLLYHERITTTLTRAKALRPFVERIIHRAKKKDLHNIREVEKKIKNKLVLYKLFHDIGERFQNREGGYVRIIRLGKRQKDSADMAIIEIVERKLPAEVKEENKKLREKLKFLSSY